MSNMPGHANDTRATKATATIMTEMSTMMLLYLAITTTANGLFQSQLSHSTPLLLFCILPFCRSLWLVSNSTTVVLTQAHGFSNEL